MNQKIIKLPLLAAFMFLVNFATAQVSELKLVNNSPCPVTVQVHNNDASCNAYCSSAVTTVPANTTVSIQLNCLGNDKGGSTQVDIIDNQSMIRIGTGCGLPTSDNYLDCTGTVRSASMAGPGVTIIN